jgi:hypothetical protein
VRNEDISPCRFVFGHQSNESVDVEIDRNRHMYDTRRADEKQPKNRLFAMRL